jgi:hypothetical protein
VLSMLGVPELDVGDAIKSRNVGRQQQRATLKQSSMQSR